MDALFTTIVHRPYVFAFLAAYLVLSIRRWGWERSLLWLLSGYFIAWLSEFSSTGNGFPYGEYHYIYENLKGELLFGGVPFFDSLSYPFLIFAGYTTAEFIARRSSRVAVAIWGAVLTMLLDVIIDPIATMGDKWFLGQIHYYAHPGFYFGVPMTNFAGWFLVSLTVIAVNVSIWRLLDISESLIEIRNNIYPLFYASIAVFNIAVTFWVDEWKLGIASWLILSGVVIAVMRASRNGPGRQMTLS